jgi:molecular chaperone GrpE (heat shock protein)
VKPRVLDRGREMFRAVVDTQRESAKALASERRRSKDIALGALEALEMLSDALDAQANDVREAARRRLEQAGVRLDGAPGEPLDLARHRVVMSRRAAVEQPTVRTVVRAGVTIGGVRVRPAEVVIDEPEER